MHLREQISYDAPIADVFAMLCTKKFRDQVCEEMGALRYEVTITAVAETATIRISRVLPAEVPDLVKKFVGDEIEIVSTEIWSAPDAAGARSAQLLIEIPGKPAQMRGSIRLDQLGSATLETVEGEIKVSVPFIGARIEGEIANAVRAAIGLEEAVGTSWLAGGAA